MSRFQRIVLAAAIIGILVVYTATPPVYVARGDRWTRPSPTSTARQALVPVADLRTLTARLMVVLTVTGLLLLLGSRRRSNQPARPKDPLEGESGDAEAIGGP